jgi:hypothetical protein
MLHKLVLLMALSFCAGGCALFHETSGVTPAAEGSTNANGYALLFDLLGDEKNVSKLLIIKRERAELRDLIREIAQRCGKAHDELERFARADRTLNLKAHGLPPAESESRAPYPERQRIRVAAAHCPTRSADLRQSPGRHDGQIRKQRPARPIPPPAFLRSHNPGTTRYFNVADELQLDHKALTRSVPG